MSVADLVYQYFIASNFKYSSLIKISLLVRGDMHPAKWGAKVGNSWRTTGDISDSWERYKPCTQFVGTSSFFEM